MYGFVITTAGEAMLARAAAGEALVLDAVTVGRGVVESAAAAKGLSALIDPVAAATSTAPAVSGNQISMTVEYRNDLNGGLEVGFALSEFGISAHVGDDPAALLYYGSLGDTPQPVKPASEGLDVHRFPVAIAVTGEVSVTLEYPAGGFLTEDDLGELNFDPAGSAKAVQENLDAHTTDKNNPHGVAAEQVPYDNSRTELASDTAQGAIDELYARMYGDLKVQVQVYETGTTTPISGVIVTGIVSEIGGVCYADEDGIAIGYVLSDEQSATVTVQVDTRYIDLTEQTSQEVTLKKGMTANATIYATRVSNPSGKVETFTNSTQKRFTDKVGRVDVHAFGAGAGGSRGYAKYNYAGSDSTVQASGGKGGGAGQSVYEINVSFTPFELFDIVIGEKGVGASASQKDYSSSTSSSSAVDSLPGTRGGASTCLGVTAEGGKADVTRSGVDSNKISINVSKPMYGSDGADSTNFLFGEAALGVLAGGDGGGGHTISGLFYYEATTSAGSNGGTPYGGKGGSIKPHVGSPSAGNGESATGTAGGGGGGSSYADSGKNKLVCAKGGDGGDGAIFIRWFYA